MTILFADVAGSTELGEQLDPERLRDVLDSFFAAMRREIEAEGGIVEKFIGDAVVAVFGVPTAHEDDPTRALRAALRMRRGLDRLNRSLEDVHAIRLAMRIGVNTGVVVARAIPGPGGSSPGRRERRRTIEQGAPVRDLCGRANGPGAAFPSGSWATSR